jgi:hypothetical protein
MKRLLAIVALLMAFANVVSPVMAASIADNLSAPIVESLDDGTCLTPTAGVHHKVAFKPCSRKVNGKSIQCHVSPMLFPVAAGMCFGDTPQGWDSRDYQSALFEVFAGQFRPPRSTVA